MSGELDLINQSAERLFADHVDAELHDAVAAGEWPAELWDAITAVGFERAEMTVHGVALARMTGRFVAPIPLAETILTASVLKEAGLEVPSGPMTTSFEELQRVPWARHASCIATINDIGVLAVFEGAKLECSPGCNLAGEPRDTIILGSAKPIARIDGFSADSFLERGALLRAAQISGALETVLARTVQYAGERKQFGRPIAKFQAIQHHLANLAGYTAMVCAAVDAAAAAPDLFSIASAKSCASEAAGEAAAIAHQVHGAIGFTQEHDLHRLTKSLWSWREEFGSESYWNARIGAIAASAGGKELWPNLVARSG